MNKKTLADAKAFNHLQGQHFFDRDTMKFFSSRIHTDILKGKYFITSERSSFAYDSPRRFTVRAIDWKTGNIKHASEFLQFATKQDALAFIKQLIEEEN